MSVIYKLVFVPWLLGSSEKEDRREVSDRQVSPRQVVPRHVETTTNKIGSAGREGIAY